MDHSSVNPITATPSSAAAGEDDDWDTEGFVIPSLTLEETDLVRPTAQEVADTEPPPKAVKEEAKIYLGPHGAPPSQAKQQEFNSASRKKQFKNKLKEADRKFAGTGRENKVETLQELAGGRASSVNMAKGSAREWLDPHCHESQFEKYSR